MTLNGKCALISGGSVGIGKAIADLLVHRGANVFVVARREEPLKAAVEDFKRQAVSASQHFGYFSGDVSDYDTVQKAVAAAETECGPPTVLVNSAGFSLPGYFEKLPLSDIETEIKVNYLGTIYMVKQVINGMIERREGWIQNISSLAGLKGIFGYTGYSGAKFAIVGFSESLRSELRPYNIRVTVLCPPDVATERFLNDKREKPLEMVRLSEGAKVMQPGDVARAAVEGMEKGPFIIIPNLPGKALHMANRIAPWVVDRFIKRTIDKVRKERGF